MDINIINRGFTVIKSRIRALELEAIRKNNLDISDVQWNYLVWLGENKGTKMNDLAHVLGVQKGTLSNNIKYLIAKGLVTKQSTGRRTVVVPTEKGMQYIKIHEQTHLLIGAELQRVLTNEEVEALTNIGMKLKEGL